MKRVLLYISIPAVILLACFLYAQEERVYEVLGRKSQEEQAPEETPVEEEERPEKIEATVLAVGDIMAHTIQITNARQPEGGYDFGPSFEHVSPYLKDADLAVGNLETTFAGKEGAGYSGSMVRFNAPDELAFNLKEAGFDLLCTANNHSLDTGEKGVHRTLEIVEKAGLLPFGTARSPEERDEPVLVDVNGIKVAFLAYTDSTNGIPIPGGRDYLVNFIDVNSEEGLKKAAELFQADFRRARWAGAELVAVYMHWGWEYHLPGPNPTQERLAEKLARAGADIIFGSHPHVIQPMEHLTVEKENGAEHRALVVYSMGNFVSNQHYIPPRNGRRGIPTGEVKHGLMVRVHLAKEESGRAFVEDVDYLLTWVNRDYKHQVIPVHRLVETGADRYKVPEHKYEEINPRTERIVKRLDSFQPASYLREALASN